MSLKNWERICKRKCNTLVQNSYENALHENLVWPSKIKEELSTIWLAYLYINVDGTTINTFSQLLYDIFHQNAFADIKNENSKLRTYGLLKTEIRKESYLDKIENVQDRISLTKFRLSNHVLMIEKGRHLNIHKKLRFCNFCPKVEDEFHFLMECKTYSKLRLKLWQNITIKVRAFDRLDSNSKFRFMLSDPDVAHLVSQYLTRTFGIRDFLLKRHKNTI